MPHPEMPTSADTVTIAGVANPVAAAVNTTAASDAAGGASAANRAIAATAATGDRRSGAPERMHRSAPRIHADLQAAIAAWEQAQHNAVVFFAEIMRRRLYLDLGYGSIHQYARQALGFSDTRTGDFVRLARKLDSLPVLRDAVARGEIGYTKAREVVSVASPRTEARWVALARQHSRTELTAKVKRARRRASTQRRQRAQASLLPGFERMRGEAGPVFPGGSDPRHATATQHTAGSDAVPISSAPAIDDAEDVPVRVTLDMTPEQYARFESLLAAHAADGGSDRVETILAGLAASLETVTRCERRDGEKSTPRGVPVQVILQECPKCGGAAISTPRGERPVSSRERDRLREDARIAPPGGGRNEATIPPSLRRAVLSRDRHTCAAPGCRHTHFLHVHHRVPRALGGENTLENLVTLCATCHRLWHERQARGLKGVGEDLG